VDTRAESSTAKDWDFDISKEEINQRLEEVVSGQAELIPVADAMRELEQKYCQGTKRILHDE